MMDAISTLCVALDRAITKGPTIYNYELTFGLNREELHTLFKEAGFNLSDPRQNWARQVETWEDLGYADTARYSRHEPGRRKAFTDYRHVTFRYVENRPSGPIDRLMRRGVKTAINIESATGERVSGWID